MKTSALALMTMIALSTSAAWSASHSISIAEQMTSAMSSLKSTLNPEQAEAASFRFDSDEKAKWRYFPNPSLGTTLVLPSHKGLSVGKMSSEQLTQVMDLLALGLTSEGMDAVHSARQLDQIDTVKYRGLRNWLMFHYSEKNYFLSVFGEPGDAKWAWRFEGHHISVTFNVDQSAGDVSLTPAFIGTTEAQVLMGDRTVEVLKPVVLKTKALAATLSPAQLAEAKQSMSGVPMFNQFAPGIMGGKLEIKKPLAKGASVQSMSPAQQKMVREILAAYRAQIRGEVKNANVEAAINGKIDDLELVWAGDEKMEDEFYFRIQGQNFVLEFTCSEEDSTHYHSVLLDI